MGPSSAFLKTHMISPCILFSLQTVPQPFQVDQLPIRQFVETKRHASARLEEKPEENYATSGMWKQSSCYTSKLMFWTRDIVMTSHKRGYISITQPRIPLERGTTRTGQLERARYYETVCRQPGSIHCPFPP